jgi:hypothetical protein
MESEQSQNFNERLSQWVANQGFWFQLRYSMTGSGTAGTAMFHLLRMVFRLLVFVLIIAAGGWVYLEKTSDSKKAGDVLKDKIKAGLYASEIDMKGFSRAQGELSLNHLVCQGENNTFFTSLEARNIRCKMGLLDGITGSWDTGTIAISRLEMNVRAGADDEESAKMLSKAIFTNSEKVTINAVDVSDASLHWGYSERTRGSIENSVMKLQRQGEGWKMSFRGGKFSQNWLKDLDIVNLVISCDPEGLVFEKAELRSGQGTVDFAGLKVTGGERPTVEGMAKVRRLSLQDTLPSVVRNFVEGSISGDFKVSGSTNSAEGIGFDGQVTLDDQDVVTLRDRIYLLNALSGVDYVRNYHRVDFKEGAFHLKTSGGGLVLTDVTLKAGDLFTLEGNMRVRLPTPEETRDAAEKGPSSSGASIFNVDDGTHDESGTRKLEDSDLTLRRAAVAAKKGGDGTPDGTPSLFDRMGVDLDARQLEAQAAERLSRTLRYDGMFKISIPPDAFDTAPKLLAQYPVNPNTNRIQLAVPIQGSLYDEITLKQGEDIYQMREGGTH